MKIGPNRLTPVQLKDQLLQARSAYNEGKEKVIEQSITALEAKTNVWLIGLFVGMILIGWMIAFFWEIRVETLFNAFGLIPVTVTFFVSYFAFFFVSKMLVKPSAEELADDTSYIPLFSARERRERRGLLAAAFGVLHTAIFLGYLVAKESPGRDLP